MQSSKSCTGNTQNAAIITQFEAIAKVLHARGRIKVATAHQTLHQAVKRSAGVLEHPGDFRVITTSHSSLPVEQQMLFEQQGRTQRRSHALLRTNGTG